MSPKIIKHKSEPDASSTFLSEDNSHQGSSYNSDVETSGTSAENSTVESGENSEDNSVETDFLTPEDTSEIKLIQDKFNQTYLPMITESYSKINKLNQSEKYKGLIALSPEIHFNKNDMAQFIGWYMFLKAKFVEVNAGTGVNVSDIFEAFEKYDKELMEKVDVDIAKDLLYVVTQTIKSAKNRDYLTYKMGIPGATSIFKTLEFIREFHCGARSIPAKIDRLFNMIVFGKDSDDSKVTHNNVDSVRIHMEYINCVTLFHPVKDNMTSSKQAEVFIQNMSKSFKEEFVTYLTKNNKYNGSKELGDQFESLESVLAELEEYRKDSTYQAKVDYLNSMQIPKEIRIVSDKSSNSNETKSTKANSNKSTNPSSNNSNGKNNSNNSTSKNNSNTSNGKNNGKAKVVSNSIQVGLVSTNNIDGFESDDLSARPW